MKPDTNCKTLYISDLDGTLLDKKAKLSRHSEELIKRFIENGGLFSVATARSQSAVSILSRLDIRIPSIHLNGVLMYDYKNRKYIGCTPMDTDSALKIIDILKSFDRMSFVYNFDSDCGINVEFERLSNEVEKNFFEARKNNDYKSFRRTDNITVSDDKKVIYFTMVDRYERLYPIFCEIKKVSGAKPTLYRDNYSDMYFLEVFSSSASKAAGMMKIKELVGADRVVAFGDNLNDIEMLKAADIGIAVGDSVDEVKEQADIIIGNSYEDGVAEYLIQCSMFNVQCSM